MSAVRAKRAPTAANTLPEGSVAMVECADAISESLAKARGIAFVMWQATSHREIESPELEGFAQWAVADFLETASEKFKRYSELARQKMAEK
jgi:hypothetical protein